LFSSSASRKEGGIFTIDKAGAAADMKHFKGPINLVDLAKEEKLSQITLVESNFINFLMARKYFDKIDCQFRFGLKLIVCNNIEDKSEESFKSESKIVIFLKDDSAYQKLINIFTKAANDGFYYVPRIDWKYLNENWSDNLILGLPFYSSFIAKNLLTFASIMPIIPSNPLILKEIDQQLPFDDLINDAVDQYAKSNNYEIENVKSIYYKNRDDAKKFLIYRCILERNSWDVPNMDAMCSKEFSYESYKELISVKSISSGARLFSTMAYV
jgi:DNA polymerase III alpha subunit